MQEYEKYPELAAWLRSLEKTDIEGLTQAAWAEFIGEVNAALKEARQRGVAFGPSKEH